MCFYNGDCDWYASVYEVDPAATSERPVRCDECCRPIPAGTPYTHIYMREHEDYWPYDSDNDEEASGPFPEGDEPDPGNEEWYDRCADCSRLLEAVEAEELARGCKPHEARPGLTAMRETIGELDPDDRRAYRDRARAMFPAIDPAFADRMFSIYADDAGVPTP